MISSCYETLLLLLLLCEKGGRRRDIDDNDALLSELIKWCSFHLSFAILLTIQSLLRN